MNRFIPFRIHSKGRGGCFSPALFLLLILCSVAAGQQRISSAFVQPASKDSDAQQDTLGFISPKIVASEDRGKSTSLAMLLSAVVPGAGQVYSHRYWTIPVIWGFGAYFYSQFKYANDLYRQNGDSYDASVQADSTHRGSATLLTLRDFYRDERDRFTIYLVLTYLLNLVDAYVGASLYGFDVSDNLGGGKSVRMKFYVR